MRALNLCFGILIILLLSQTGCTKPRPSLSPADEKLVSAYSELLLLSEEFKSPHSTLDSASYQKEVRSVLSRNGLTKEELTNRLNTLSQSEELFSQFQIKVADDLEHRKSKQPL
jgi:hypothetical protein